MTGSFGVHDGAELDRDPLDDPDLALASDWWRCRYCGRPFPGPSEHPEDECLISQVMES